MLQPETAIIDILMFFRVKCDDASWKNDNEVPAAVSCACLFVSAIVQMFRAIVR